MRWQSHDETEKTSVQAEIYRGFSDAISDDFDLQRRWKPGLIRLFFRKGTPQSA